GRLHGRSRARALRVRAARGRRGDGERGADVPLRSDAVRRREGLGARPRGSPERDRAHDGAAPPRRHAPARRAVMAAAGAASIAGLGRELESRRAPLETSSSRGEEDKAMAVIKVGTMAPEFKLKDENANEVALSSFRGKQNVVLCFYPFDFSPVCSTENT